jgi:drug/metabolite transporter (DMT)-like permease
VSDQKISSLNLLFRLMIGVIAVSFAALFVRFAQANAMPVLAIAAWRLIFACTVVLPYSWMTCRAEILSIPRREAGLVTCSGVFLGLHFAAWIASLGYTSVASSVVLVSMGPLFVALGSWLFLHELPARKTIFGLVLAALGSICVGSGDWGRGSDQLLGDLLALAGAVFVAGYLLVGRKVRAGRSLAAYIAPVYGISMITLLIILAVARQPLLGFPLGAYGWALALGLLPQLVGHSTLNWALAHLSASFVAVVTLAEPIGASLLAWAILKEGISLQTAIGAVPILAGIYLASRAELISRHQ